MTDFEEFARQRQDAFAAKERARDVEAARRRAERDARWEAGRDRLNEVALPILEAAKAAYEKLGHRVALEGNWKHGLVQDPAYTLTVHGQKKRPYDVSTYEVSGEAVECAWSEERGAIVAEKVRGRQSFGQDAAGVTAAAKYALESLYSALEK